MTAFSASINVIFTNPHIAESAEYRAGGAEPAVSVRVIKRRPDVMSEFNTGRFVRNTVFVDVRVSEVSDLKDGDTFTIDGVLLTVTGEPVRDSERLVWKAEARE